MFRAVVPAEHFVGDALGCGESENALEVAGTDGYFAIAGFLGIVRDIFLGETGKETGRRELAVVADDNELFPAGDGAEGIDGKDLTGLIEDDQIEIEFSRFKELGDGKGAHHKNRFDRLNGRSGCGEEFADRHVVSLFVHLATENTDRPKTTFERETVAVFEKGFGAGDGDAGTIQFAEVFDEAVVFVPIKAGKFGNVGQKAPINLAKVGQIVGVEGVLMSDATVNEPIGERTDAGCVSLAASEVEGDPLAELFTGSLPESEFIEERGEGDPVKGGGIEGGSGVELKVVGKYFDLFVGGSEGGFGGEASLADFGGSGGAGDDFEKFGVEAGGSSPLIPIENFLEDRPVGIETLVGGSEAVGGGGGQILDRFG